MSVNGMSVGRDYAILFYDQDLAQLVNFGDIQNINITAMKHDIKSQPYNDIPKFGYIPDGYKITFDVVRTSQDFEDYQLNRNAAFNAGQAINGGYLQETVTNPDSSTSKYKYVGFVFFVTDISSISRDKNVTMKAEGMAGDKVPL